MPQVLRFADCLVRLYAACGTLHWHMPNDTNCHINVVKVWTNNNAMWDILVICVLNVSFNRSRVVKFFCFWRNFSYYCSCWTPTFKALGSVLQHSSITLSSYDTRSKERIRLASFHVAYAGSACRLKCHPRARWALYVRGCFEAYSCGPDSDLSKEQHPEVRYRAIGYYQPYFNFFDQTMIQLIRSLGLSYTFLCFCLLLCTSHWILCSDQISPWTAMYQMI